jgi:uncharacterized Zn finger protein
MNNWAELFSPIIMDRGMGYYQNGAVRVRENTTSKIVADVMGTESYRVGIAFNGSLIESMDCECPYALDGNHCKHMAAVMLWRENHAPVQHAERPVTDTDATQLLADTNVQTMRVFLTNQFKRDPHLFELFKQYATSTELPADEMRRYRQQIDAIMQRHEDSYSQMDDDYDEYQDYYDRPYGRRDEGPFKELQDYIGDTISSLIASHHVIEATRLVDYIAEQAGPWEPESTSDSFDVLMRTITTAWTRLLAQKENDVTQTLFDWLQVQLVQTHDVNAEYWRTLRHFWLTNFKDSRFVQAKDALTVKKVDQNDSDNPMTGEVWARVWLTLAQTLGKKEQSIIEFCQNHIQLDAVRQYYVDLLVQKGDLDTAEKVLRGGKQRPDDGHFAMHQREEYSVQLKDLYQQTHNIPAYRHELQELVTQYDAYSEKRIRYYKELKSAYSPIEWRVVREKLFAAVSSPDLLAHFYLIEDMYDRLLQIAMQQRNSNMLHRFEAPLLTHYPEIVLAEYQKELSAAVRFPTKRTHYARVARTLRDLQAYPQARQFVSNLVQKWRREYSNRPAMMAELAIIHDASKKI